MSKTMQMEAKIKFKTKIINSWTRMEGKDQEVQRR